MPENFRYLKFELFTSNQIKSAEDVLGKIWMLDGRERKQRKAKRRKRQNNLCSSRLELETWSEILSIVSRSQIRYLRTSFELWTALQNSCEEDTPRLMKPQSKTTHHSKTHIINKIKIKIAKIYSIKRIAELWESNTEFVYFNHNNTSWW